MLNAAFELTDHEVLRNRVLVAEQSLAGLHRTSAREEESRQLARSQMRDLEFAWATFLTRGMEQGAIPQADPRLLARAILGLYNSVWHWYRPRGGSLSIEQIREFFVGRCLAVAGLPLDRAGEAEAKRKPAAKRKSLEARRAPRASARPRSGRSGRRRPCAPRRRTSPAASRRPGSRRVRARRRRGRTRSTRGGSTRVRRAGRGRRRTPRARRRSPRRPRRWRTRSRTAGRRRAVRGSARARGRR